jgi:hypothetical protein
MSGSPYGEENESPSLSPPPPAVQDEEIAHLVDESLARRQQRGWSRHSIPHSPLSPSSRKRRDEEDPLIVPEEAEEETSEGRQSRPGPSRTLTSGSVKLEGLIQLERELGAQKVLYRYVDVYENQRG